MSRTLLWFRNDLRLTDNPALAAALAQSGALIPIYIHAPDEQAPWQPGGASRWWLHHSLKSLQQQLNRRGSRLLLLTGSTLEILTKLVEQAGITHLFWNRCYDPARVSRDNRIKSAMSDLGIECRSFNSALLFEPWEIQNQTGRPFRVFTPFWRRCQQVLSTLEPPLPAPDTLPRVKISDPGGSLEALGLLPQVAWNASLAKRWKPGEAQALTRLSDFLSLSVNDYPASRDRPDRTGTSSLSPHLHFGEIGPRQILHALLSQGSMPSEDTQDGTYGFLRQLGWREFAYHLLHHFPHTPQTALNPKFQAYPWTWGEQQPLPLQTWQQGRTGIPIVDAGMRELWHTGWMHNRVRMIVASWLTKNLGIHWLEGAHWFWDTLVDADLACNTLGWQWTAGCGADAAPFFRIFNPVRQGERFDPQGHYVRRWVPELAALPDNRLHAPWEADELTLNQADVRLGETYPEPMADLKHSRERALALWNRIR
jgi:deoxyribodipyrimidine photo-lyase